MLLIGHGEVFAQCHKPVSIVIGGQAFSCEVDHTSEIVSYEHRQGTKHATPRSAEFQTTFEKIVIELGFEDNAMTANGQAPMAPSNLIMVIDLGKTRTHLPSMRGPSAVELRATSLASMAAPCPLFSRLALSCTDSTTLLGP